MGQVAAHDIHNHNHLMQLEEPPDDPRVAFQCPQCARLTWRFSRQCMHCRLFFSDWRSRQRRDRFKRLAMACLGLGGAL